MQNQSSPGTVKHHLSERLGQLDAITGAQEDRRGIGKLPGRNGNQFLLAAAKRMRSFYLFDR
jgi:hypothetical protein